MDARTRVRMAAAGVALSLVLAQAGPLASAAFAEAITVGADTIPVVTAVAAAEATVSLDASPAIAASDTVSTVDAEPAALATATAPTATPEAPAPVTPAPIKVGSVTPMIVTGPYGYLWTPYHAQERPYWCGPATCQIVTHYLGRLYSQATFANYMRTTTDGTAFYKVAYALSNYSGRAYYYYGGLSSGAVTTKVSDSISAHGQPLVADVSITPGIWNQYRFIHSGHILPVEGYDWRYGSIRVCDPYNEASWKLGGGQTGGHVTHTLSALLSGISKHPQHAVVAAP